MTTHRAPADPYDPTPCCGRHPEELPELDTITHAAARVDCPGPAPTDPLHNPVEDGTPTEETTTP